MPAVYRTLVPGLEPPRVVRRGRYSPSALLWHTGAIGSPPPDAAHHNIHFGHEWRESFDALRDGHRMPDPSILVTVPTISDPGLAPPGASVVYALEPVPNLDGRLDWSTEREPALGRLRAAVARFGYPSDALVSEAIDPLGWEAGGLERGTPFSLSHTFWQSGPFRPSNVERRAPGLVLAGSGTRPGVGVPLVLISGRLAADQVERCFA